MIRYEWRDKVVAILNAKQADPQVIGEELARLMAANDGNLKPEAVHEAAKNRRSPLHRHFEWDDAKAADAYRVDQARGIIRLIKAVEITDGGRELYAGPAFVSIYDGRRRTYKAIGEVVTNTRLQLLVMQQAIRDLEAWEKRYGEFEEICQLVRVARERLADARAEIETVAGEARPH